MSVEDKSISPTETQVASGQLVLPVNENMFGLTQRGKLALEVVLLNNSLDRHNNPDIAFAMTPEQTGLVTARREELCRELDMPLDERERRTIIAGYQQELETHGFPHWRVIDSPISTDGINSGK